MAHTNAQPRAADLAIVGAGAAGLMAAVSAAEAGLKPVLIERKHKPGRKLLMCGNARCNLTNMQPAEPFLADLGDPVAPFVEKAIRQFPPQALREWLRTRGLKTIEKRGGRVFPATERAADVLNHFQDLLRQNSVPLLLNSPVTAIEHAGTQFTIATPAYAIQAKRVLVCTGGVTYPKTGSVGDGQKLAATFGHGITPYRGGLVGLEINLPWLASCAQTKFEDITATATLRSGSTYEVAGDLELQRWGFCGGLISNATRLAAHADSVITKLTIDLIGPQGTQFFNDARTPQQALKRVYRDVPPKLWHQILPEGIPRKQALQKLQAWTVPVQRARPLKEAMVTVGGIALNDINPHTMESARCPGLYFAGEVLDIDGPTGGFNLQLAFATARLAIAAIAPGKLDRAARPQAPDRNRSRAPRKNHSPHQHKRRR